MTTGCKKNKIENQKKWFCLWSYPQNPYLCTAFTKSTCGNWRQAESREKFFSIPRRESQSRIYVGNAAIAQLVEHDLAKVGVASSSLVCRSKVDL